MLRHDGPVTALAFDAGGKIAASAAGGTVRLWEVRGTRDSGSGRLLGELEHAGKNEADNVEAVSFSRDGKALLTRSLHVRFPENGELQKRRQARLYRIGGLSRRSPTARTGASF